MKKGNKILLQAGLIKYLAVLFFVVLVIMAIIIAGVRIFDGLIDKSRLSAATQTMKSTATVLLGCQVSGLTVSPPNDVKNPTNFPCLGTTKYADLGEKSTTDCVYSTTFVKTITSGSAVSSAIQAGCDCSGSDIETCRTILQCDISTDGKCTEKTQQID